MRKFKQIEQIREPATVGSIGNATKINEVINRLNLQGELICEILERHPNILLRLPPRLFDSVWEQTELIE